MSAALVAGLAAGYAIAIPVGAIGSYLLHLSARNPSRVAIAAALGVATADGGYALLAVVGGTALAASLQRVATTSRWLAAAVLVALATRTAVSAIRSYSSPISVGVEPVVRTARRAYATLLGLTLLNPATVVYFAALVIGARSAACQTSGSDRASFVVGVFVASASWQLLLAGAGTLLGRALSGRRGRLGTALISASLIALGAAQIAFGP
jgi:arginine exporter protein ArgO